MLLISLHPRHAENIFAHRKTIELRKTFPNRLAKLCKSYPAIKPGDYEEKIFDKPQKCFIYETLPTGSVTGYFMFKEIIPKLVFGWLNHKDELCLSESEIRSYLGEKVGYGIVIAETFVFKTPVPLQDLKSRDIKPPQGYLYLNASDTAWMTQKPSWGWNEYKDDLDLT